VIAIISSQVYACEGSSTRSSPKPRLCGIVGNASPIRPSNPVAAGAVRAVVDVVVDLLRMRAGRTHMAIIVDEYGGNWDGY
jgi:hypothetical protein